MNLNKILILFFMGANLLVYAQGEFAYNSQGKRDPFLPLVSKEGYLINREADLPASEMNLEGIIYDPSGKSLAMINGQVLKPGDSIGTYVVMQIEKRRVILQGNEEFVLELKQEVK